MFYSEIRNILEDSRGLSEECVYLVLATLGALAVALAGALAVTSLALATLHVLTRALAVLAGHAVLAIVGHFVYSEMRFFIRRSGRLAVGTKHPGEPNLPRDVGERPRLPESALLPKEAREVSEVLYPL
jgi:hypothetical protein